MRLGLLIAALVIFALVLLLACLPAPQKAQLAASASPAAVLPDANLTGEAARYGGALTVRLRQQPGTLNPYSVNPEMRRIAQLVFAGLMRLDSTMRPVPNLAESWTTTPDELTWTFKLRPGVRWHDGTTLTSDDILFTLRTLMEVSPIDGGDIGLAQADFQQIIRDVEVAGPYLVRLRLRQRFAPLLADLTIPILPRHILEDKPWAEIADGAIDIGAGPFRLLDRRSDIILEAFPQYHLGRPHLDRVAFVVTPDDQVAASALADGRLMLAEIGSTTAEGLADNPAFDVLTYREPTFYYVGFNLRPGRPFSEKAVRQAWAYAIDKESLVRKNVPGVDPAWNFPAEYSWAADASPTVVRRDLARSKRILDEAGWQQLDQDGIRVKNGRSLRGTLQVRNDAPERMAAARDMVVRLREAGIGVDVVAVDFESTMAAARLPPFPFDALLMGWTMGIDPDDYYLFHSSQIPSADRPTGFNYVGFRSDDFDRLSIEARGTVDWQRRADIYRQTQRIVADSLPYYLLWSERSTWAVNKRLSGLAVPFGPSFSYGIHRWQMTR